MDRHTHIIFLKTKENDRTRKDIKRHQWNQWSHLEQKGNERTRKEMQGAYRNGKMVDKWFFYDKNGNLKEIRYFSPAF